MLYHITGSYIGSGQAKELFVEASSVIKARKAGVKRGIENARITRADPDQVPEGVTVVEVEADGSFFDLDKRPVRTIAAGVILALAVWTVFMLVLKVLGFVLFVG